MEIDHRVRVLRQDELRTANDLVRGCLHRPSASDDEWRHIEHSYQAGRTLGAFDGDELIGTAGSFRTRTRVPGGALLPTAAVVKVGVRADHTRRGALSALMRAQLDAAVAAGEPLAQLRASEGPIYGRFGYGVAARHASRIVARVRAEVVGDPRPRQRIRLVDGEAGFEQLAPIYHRNGPHRVGMIERPAVWWAGLRARQARADWQSRAVLHGEPGQERGYAYYRVTGQGSRTELHLDDFHAGSDEAYRDLWRFLLSVDLVDDVHTELSAVDDPVELLLADRAACRVEVTDEIWLRLVEVPEALARRQYGAAEPVTIEVTDGFRPANSGRYRITVDGASRITAEPDLRMSADTLAALYLGDVAASRLATAGRVEVADPAALARADRLFATAETPWCGTYF